MYIGGEAATFTLLRCSVHIKCTSLKIWKLEPQTKLYGTMEEMWDYFSSPMNLNDITPPDMQFEVLTDLSGKKMYAGLMIEYIVRPFLHIPMQWVTEITHCVEHSHFVDEQRFGPYALWHHQHHFSQQDDHILMTDTVHYAIGWGPLGRLAHVLLVRGKLQHIFDFREQVMERRFGRKKATA